MCACILVVLVSYIRVTLCFPDVCFNMFRLREYTGQGGFLYISVSFVIYGYVGIWRYCYLYGHISLSTFTVDERKAY